MTVICRIEQGLSRTQIVRKSAVGTRWFANGSLGGTKSSTSSVRSSVITLKKEETI
jgi:hypothetical protein